MGAPQSKKPDLETLVHDIGSSLYGYLGKGINLDPVIGDIDPPLKSQSLQQLLKFNFLLTGRAPSERDAARQNIELSTPETAGITDRDERPVGVRDFIALLPHRVQSLDSRVRPEVEVYTGEVRGRIDWSATIKHRASTGDVSGQAFACRVQQPSLDTPRNLVLLELLHGVRTVIKEFDEHAEESPPEWFAPWFSLDDVPQAIKDANTAPNTAERLAELREQETGFDEDPEYYELLRPNIEEALSRSGLSEFDLSSIHVSPRQLRQVRNDRSQLYREAAALLTHYRRLQTDDIAREFSEKELRSTLQSSMFQPRSNVETLFELYWIFDLLDHFETPERFNYTLADEDGGSIIAAWEADEFQYRLYNDWNGTDGDTEYMRIRIPTADDLASVDSAIWGIGDADSANHSNQVARRSQFILSNRYKYEEGVLGRDRNENFQTPDIVLLKLQANTEPPVIEEVFIGEVKHSTSHKTLGHGFQQLFRYGALAEIGADATIARASDTQFLAQTANPFESERVRLGYFVGHNSEIGDSQDSRLQIKGHPDATEHPFE